MAIYLDNAATTYPKPPAVWQAMEHFMKNIGASAGRGGYRRALAAEEIVFLCRRLLGKLFNIDDATRIVFTANATEAINLVLKGWLNPGDHVVTTAMEHNAVWRCLKTLEKERGISITVVPCREDGELLLPELDAAFREKTRLLACTHASNVTGTVMPVQAIAAVAHRHGVPVLLDAAQTAGVYTVDVRELDVDFLAFTGHKGLLGPTGTGGLYIRPGLDLRPLKEGGTGSVSRLEYMPENLPDRFEAGTLNMVGIAGLKAALEYILNQGIDRIRAHEEELTARMLAGLAGLPGVTVYGPRETARKVGVVSFNLKELAPEEVAYALDEGHDIMVRVGLHCAPLAHKTIGTLERGTVRASVSYFNTAEEIDTFLTAVRDIVELTS
ncbi:Cysteine desulfurase [Moorella humiferrea]|uniref:cysteine desulfurase n=1 Tax=Neomoorella humiferrea TaxID=676965 RepID=UPI0030D13E23